MTTPESFDAKLDRIQKSRRRRTPDQEKSFIRDEIEFSVFSMITDFILFGGWYVLAGLASFTLIVLFSLDFIGLAVGGPIVVVIALFLLFNALSER